MMLEGQEARMLLSGDIFKLPFTPPTLQPFGHTAYILRFIA